MKRYEELTVLTKQSDETMVQTRPIFPSRCLSIGLREMEEMETLAQRGLFSWLPRWQLTSDKK